MHKSPEATHIRSYGLGRRISVLVVKRTVCGHRRIGHTLVDGKHPVHARCITGVRRCAQTPRPRHDLRGQTPTVANAAGSAAFTLS